MSKFKKALGRVGTATLIRVTSDWSILTFLGCPEAIDFLGQPYKGWEVRKAVGKFWGNWSGRGSNLLPLAQGGAAPLTFGVLLWARAISLARLIW